MQKEASNKAPQTQEDEIGFGGEGDEGEGDLEYSSTKAGKFSTFQEDLLEEGSSKAAKHFTHHKSSYHEGDSSEDEVDHIVPDLPSSKSTNHFNFYSTFEHLVPFHEILDSFHTLKLKYSKYSDKNSDKIVSSSSEQVKTLGGKSKSFDIRLFQRTQETLSQKSSTHKISRFRPPEPKWDGSFSLDKELEGQIYRTPDSDPSGKVIFSLSRDEAKGAKPWKLPERDRDLPPPTLDQCPPRLQKQILSHMDEIIRQVERDYNKHPALTQEQSTEKAKMGADLANLKRQREELLRHVERRKRSEKKKGGETLFGV